MKGKRETGRVVSAHQGEGNRGFKIFAIICFMIAVFVALCICLGFFRMDQYAVTIFGTTAGIVGTMFGLTAASYAFIWGDLRSDGRENRHLGKVLEQYSERLWQLFKRSLCLSVAVIFSSLIGLAFAQHIMSDSLFKTEAILTRAKPDLFKKAPAKGVIAQYYNEKFRIISLCALFNLMLSAVAVYTMAWMNGAVFQRNRQYAAIAESILNSICTKYNMELPDEKSGNPNSIEYEKIHNLEILVERILKNHESIGEAFSEFQRRRELLTAVMTNSLKSSYDVSGKGAEVPGKMGWDCLEERKRISHWMQCRENALWEYGMLERGCFLPSGKEDNHPLKHGFIAVYEDMLSFRDNSLVWEEKCGGREAIDLFSRRALRYTVKKRLLIFYLRGERFSDMDLAGISFSGADLRFTNLSNCNLTGIRLKGANCEGADFSGSRMTGMFFSDMPETEQGDAKEIKLTCMDKPWEDDDGRAWDPYKGREATFFREAAFKEADVSRAYLSAPGELSGDQEFPFGAGEANRWRLKKEMPLFTLAGTNFDHAKMFFSFFKNIDFNNASLAGAQMYNTGVVQSRAKTASLSGTVLTNACLAWCDFENADFSGASLAKTILARVNFKGAKMENVNFSYSNIFACNFEGSSCQNASFKNVTQDWEGIEREKPRALKGIELGGQESLRFCYATLTNTDFSGADLDGVLFSNAVGQNCIFTKTRGRRAVFDNGIFISSIFNTAEFEDCSLKETVLRNSIFTDSFFINSLFERADFSGALFNRMRKPVFLGGFMSEVDFTDAGGLTANCFFNICLRNVIFKGTGIREIDFGSSVRLENCKF